MSHGEFQNLMSRRDNQMKYMAFLCSSLILAVSIACSGTSTGDEIGPTAQEEGRDAVADLAGIDRPLSFKVARVLEYGQNEEGTSPESSAEDRLKASTLEFSEDGAFVYNTTRGLSTLYPVQGKYRVEDDGIGFSGSKTHSYGSAGEASVTVEGKVDLDASEGPVAAVVVREKITASTSAYGGTRSINETSVFSGKLLLEPAS
ncbi:MAG TPA: hypothetical protein VFA32_03370 [Dehalococcoidia bacterium]|jgi:hypothetical protein|nr:hypothetical protein [Dehalococcoidia bacterium]